MTRKAISPGKLILSGEHAVLYGSPALAVAVNCYAESVISMKSSKSSDNSQNNGNSQNNCSNNSSHQHPFPAINPAIFFNLLNLRYARRVTTKTLQSLRNRILEDYHAFLQGKQSIRDVLKKPFELLQFTVGILIENLNVTLPHGVEIKASSNIPMGCGMGSSAATVMSTLHAFVDFFQLQIEPKHYLTLGRAAENLQHGRSSGLDLQLSLQGGALRFQNGQVEKREIPSLPLFIVQTGKPCASTGLCVSHVKPYFEEKGSTLTLDFESVTEAMDLALQNNHLEHFQEAIRQNHRLLTHIGVVPFKVQQFIKQLESLGLASKICGAGSVTGEKAGVLLVVGHEVDKNSGVQQLLDQYGYTLQKVEVDLGGTVIV